MSFGDAVPAVLHNDSGVAADLDLTTASADHHHRTPCALLRPELREGSGTGHQDSRSVPHLRNALLTLCLAHRGVGLPSAVLSADILDVVSHVGADLAFDRSILAERAMAPGDRRGDHACLVHARDAA